MVTVVTDTNFDARFQSIVQRWYSNVLAQVDRIYLSTTRVAVDEFDELTEQFKRGIELVNYHVELTECSTVAQEYLSRMFDSWVTNAYGEQDIACIGSACTYRPIP
jgi:hypothetical protein